MGLSSWLSQVTRWFQASSPNTITTSQELARALWGAGRDSSSGIQVSQSNASGLAAVAVCERVLTSDLAQLPLILYAKNGTKKEQAKEGPRAQLYRVLASKANDNLTSYQFRKIMWRDWFYRGNAYARIVRGFGGDVIGLVRLHPDGVEVKEDERTGKITYEFRKPYGQIVTYQKKDIFHFWDTSEDGVIGLDPLTAHRESIGDGLAIRRHGSNVFKNGALIGGILEVTAGKTIGPEASKALLDDFNAFASGGENSHRTVVLPGGVQWKQVGLNMQDSQWIESRKKTDRDIYGIYGVPPHKGGDLDQAAVRANVEAENISYVVGSLMPRLVCWEQCIMRDLLQNDEAYEVRHNISGLLRGDAAGRAAFYKTMRQIKAMSANEVREKEEMNPYDGGDVYDDIDGGNQDDPSPGQESPNAKP